MMNVRRESSYYTMKQGTLNELYFLSRFFRRQQRRSCLAKPKVRFRDCRHLCTKYQIKKFFLQQGINYLARGRFGKTEEQISETLTQRKEWNRKYWEKYFIQCYILRAVIWVCLLQKMSMVTKPKGKMFKITLSVFGLFLSSFSDLNHKLLEHVRRRKITDMQKSQILKGTE